MYRKLFAASVLTIGLATSAMAQSSDGTYSNHRSWWPFGNEQSSSVDHSTTGSINATVRAIAVLPDRAPRIRQDLTEM